MQLLMPIYAEPAASLNLSSASDSLNSFLPAREWSESSQGCPETSKSFYRYSNKNITGVELLMPIYAELAASLNLSSA